jgi:hypothetical protein
MAKSKSPGLDGAMVKFYVQFLHVLWKEYFEIIQDVVRKERFPKGVSKKLIMFRCRHDPLLS